MKQASLLLVLLAASLLVVVSGDVKPNKWEIPVKDLDTNKLVRLTVNPIETIKSLKFNIQDKLGVPMDKQTLFYGPSMVELTDDHILEVYEASPTIFLRVQRY